MNFHNQLRAIEEIQQFYDRSLDPDPDTYTYIDDALTGAAERLQELGFDDDDFDWDDIRREITRHSVSGEWADTTYITFENEHEDLSVAERRDETQNVLDDVWTAYHYDLEHHEDTARTKYKTPLALQITRLAYSRLPEDGAAVSAIGRIGLDADEAGDLARLAEYVEYLGFEDLDDALESFQDADTGADPGTTGPDYALQLAEDLGYKMDPCHWPFSCLDWDAAWRELEIGGDYFRTDAGYIFRNT